LSGPRCATIRLESRKDGRASWEFTDATGAAQIETETSPARPAKAVTIQKLKITDATLIYDAEGSDLVSYQGVDLALDWPDAKGAADIAAALRPAQEKVNIDARIENFGSFLTGTVQPLRAKITAKGGALSLQGRGSLEGAVAGAFALQAGNTATFLAQLGAGAVELPKGLGQSLNVTADLTLTPDRRLALRDLVADLGGNTLRGGVDVALNGVPQINAQLNAGALDLRSLTEGGEGGGSVHTVVRREHNAIEANRHEITNVTVKDVAISGVDVLHQLGADGCAIRYPELIA